MSDLTYVTYGLFVQFYPETPAGKQAWAELARHTDGTGKVLKSHLANTLRQLKRAGYIVARGKKS